LSGEGSSFYWRKTTFPSLSSGLQTFNHQKFKNNLALTYQSILKKIANTISCHSHFNPEIFGMFSPYMDSLFQAKIMGMRSCVRHQNKYKDWPVSLLLFPQKQNVFLTSHLIIL
jgi:hypothetical protein